MPRLPLHFDAAQAKAYSGATTRQLRYWDQIGIVRPSIQGTGGKPGKPRVYGRSDVLKLRAVVDLLADGTTTQRIRQATEILSRGLDRIAAQRMGYSSNARAVAEALARHLLDLERHETWSRDWPEFVVIAAAGRAA